MFDLPPLTTFLLSCTTLVITYRLIRQKYADIHPVALYHQSSISPVRNPGESAIHRSQLTPFTYPLIVGLNIRDGHAFRDGDLRDVWEFSKNGQIGEFDKSTGEIQYYAADKLAFKIMAAASKFREYVPGVSKVAIYLPNSIENVLVTFANAFADITTVLVPLTSDMDELSKHIAVSEPEILVFGAGTIDFTKLKLPSSIKSLIVVATSSVEQHVDWTQVLDEKTNASISVHTWDEATAGELSTVDPLNHEFTGDKAFAVTYVDTEGHIKLVEFSHKGVVSAIAAQLRVLPQSEGFSRADIFVPLDSLELMYNRIMLFAALTAGTNVVFCGTTGAGYDLTALKTIKATIIVLSTRSLLKLVEHKATVLQTLSTRRAYGLLAHGVLPKGVLGLLPQLRLVYAHDDQPPSVPLEGKLAADKESSIAMPSLTSADLTEVRALLGSRIIYALTCPLVAGAVCQTNIFDYRNLGHVRMFGPVLPSLEAVVKDCGELKADKKQGHLFVSGYPAAGDEWIATGIVGKWGSDGCFTEI
ncbi:uncharacterized protein V1518DRAFT_410057 [Limtongia smithiae]|uniref:uncharacterized protein n=1 Tax=Limtongia smithiae TaxID=1125753 RepID=UPI0034CE1F91